MVHHPHFLLVTYPTQGNINPSLQFAKRLLRVGAHVTFSTCVSALRRMPNNLPVLQGLSFSPFSDGYDDGFKHDVHNPEQYMSDLQRRGSQSLADIVTASADQGRPVTCIVYTVLLPWAAEVARGLHLPSTLLWVQPATVLDIYYYYFKGYEDVIRTKTKDPSCSVELPGLPLSFTARDLPSFLVSSKDDDTYSFILPTFQQHIEALEHETNPKPKVLVNTFDALEPEALRAIEKFNMEGVGPLIPSIFLDGKDPSDTCFGGDLFERGSDNYNAWLTSKPKSSVVYVSFGSLSVMSKTQMEEMGRALLDGGRPFLWVIRAATEEKEEDNVNSLRCVEELRELGMIVPWCDQLEVLSSPSLGCFVTHCGWNSTMESLVSGVPVVCFPQWTDQGTNAKLIGEAWRTGVRVVANEEGVVESGEIKRCLDMVMGEEGEEMRSNAKKWKEAAREAVGEGGTSDKNLRLFVEEVAADGKTC